jgi:radical SAM superfamily enzyme YgiQ (UPF0313 family)
VDLDADYLKLEIGILSDLFGSLRGLIAFWISDFGQFLVSGQAGIMSKAGCVGIDFAGESASTSMLRTYHQKHLKEDLASAVRLCRKNNIKVMIDLLLGGQAETPETVAETIHFIKQIGPACAGAALGLRIYPGTEMGRIVQGEGPLETNPNIRRVMPGLWIFSNELFISHRRWAQT